MIITEIYKGQGLGNQLWCYVVTRAIALDNNYQFGIKSPENFKCLEFLDLDFGEKVIGGKGPEGGPPTKLPEKIKNYYSEKTITHTKNGVDIRDYDEDLFKIKDNTKIDGIMQDERYIIKHRDEIKKWLKINEGYECVEYSKENICVINFRGGEYVRFTDLFLTQKYWDDAIKNMQKINPDMKFIVVTNDVKTARKFFSDFEITHKSIGNDYSIINNAYYLILSNSSFAFFPTWLNDKVKFVIAPKYWARHNVSDGYWSLSQNIVSNWMYQDRDGNLSDKNICIRELSDYKNKHKDYIKHTEKLTENFSLLKLIKKIVGNTMSQDTKNEIYYFKKNILLKVKNKILIKTKIIYSKIFSEVFNIFNSQISKIEFDSYRKNIKVYDIFNFFNELELLEIRLNILDPHVDYFVIVESRMTHSGLPKELYFDKNKHLFKKFANKIIHYIIEDPLKDFEDAKNKLNNPETPKEEKEILRLALNSRNIPENMPHFLRDFYEKESVKNALVNLKDDDFCFISDLDEIWNPDTLLNYKSNNIYKLKQLAYYYYLNNRSSEPWFGTTAAKYSLIKNKCINSIRNISETQHIFIKNGGWHFTYQGGADRVRQKIESFSHQEFNKKEMKESISEKLTSNTDIVDRNFRLKVDASNLPDYLIINKDKYKNMFK